MYAIPPGVRMYAIPPGVRMYAIPQCTYVQQCCHTNILWVCLHLRIFTHFTPLYVHGIPCYHLVPLVPLQLPIQPVRRTVKSTEPSKTPSKPSTSSDTQAEIKSTSRHQPVAAPDKSFNKVVQELELKRSPSPVKPPVHKSGVGSHGADVLSVAIAIAEKASVLPSSTQM